MVQLGKTGFASLLVAALFVSACASSPTSPTPKVEPDDTDQPAPPPPPPPPPPPVQPQPSAMSDLFPQTLYLCPLMNIENKPDGIDGLQITSYTPLALINESVPLARAPVEKSCFSSGFGMRTRSDGSQRPHKGIDLHNASSVNILAAGDGIIRQVLYDNGYGQFIVIEHGSGVFTRYAHLNSYSAGLEEGVSVKAGDVIGRMGTTPSVAMHLHYEVLIGNWVGGSSASYLLDPIDVMTQPAAN